MTDDHQGVVVANYDFVTPYDTEMEEWLQKQGYPHPKARPDNRFPTKKEIHEAIENSGTLQAEDAEAREFFAVKKGTKRGKGYEIRIGCSKWDRLGESSKDSITMHGYLKTELLLLEILSHKCGQLLLYPDSGAPAVIVEAGMDIEKIDHLWKDAVKRPLDMWEYFFANAGY